MKAKNPLLGALLLTQTLLAGGVGAATFDVTTSQEFQDALAQAQNNGQDDVINLAAGTYAITGDSFTYEAVDTENFDLTVQGAGADQTILEGDGAYPLLVLSSSFLSDDSQTAIRVSELTARNGDGGDTGGGGGLSIIGYKAMIEVERSKFLNNNAGMGWGGGVDLYSKIGSIRLDRCYFSENLAIHGGGAALTTATGKILATNNVFHNNSATDGAGLHVGQEENSGAAINVVNNTFFGNTSSLEGGGLLIFASDEQVSNVYNNLFRNNTATAGDDVYYLENNDSGTAFTLNLFFNDFSEVGDNCEGGNSCQARINQGNNLSVDPNFTDPTTANFGLLAGSPVIDRGDGAAPDLPELDYAGNPRVRGESPDMGAVEAAAPAQSGVSNESPDSGGCNLSNGGQFSSLLPILGAFSGLAVFRRRNR